MAISSVDYRQVIRPSFVLDDVEDLETTDSTGKGYECVEQRVGTAPLLEHHSP